MEAHVANGGCVDEGHELLDVVDENAVEEVDVTRLEGRKVRGICRWVLISS